MSKASRPQYSDRIVADYLRRSYTAVDGLWFVKVEEAEDFGTALELDRQVWEVMPKIQARRARALLDIDGDAAGDLAACFGLKLEADGHEYQVIVDDTRVRARVHRCLWLENMRRSGREHLATQIGEHVCTAEGRVWAEEFGGCYEFSLPCRRCGGDTFCEFLFVCRGQRE